MCYTKTFIKRFAIQFNSVSNNSMRKVARSEYVRILKPNLRVTGIKFLFVISTPYKTKWSLRLMTGSNWTRLICSIFEWLLSTISMRNLLGQLMRIYVLILVFKGLSFHATQIQSRQQQQQQILLYPLKNRSAVLT